MSNIEEFPKGVGKLTEIEALVAAAPTALSMFVQESCVGVFMELQGTRVLLVEDEGLVAMSVEDMLSDLGCTVAAQAGSLPEAMEKARAGGFEVALLDVSLNGKQVFPVAELLSERGIPFAFASGYGTGGLPAAFRNRPVVPKPFQVEELSAALTAALARKGISR